MNQTPDIRTVPQGPRQLTNLETGQRGVDHAYYGSGVFVWPPHVCFYEWCSEQEWLAGIFDESPPVCCGK
jgi:hypothetical protein